MQGSSFQFSPKGTPSQQSFPSLMLCLGRSPVTHSTLVARLQFSLNSQGFPSPSTGRTEKEVNPSTLCVGWASRSSGHHVSWPSATPTEPWGVRLTPYVKQVIQAVEALLVMPCHHRSGMLLAHLSKVQQHRCFAFCHSNEGEELSVRLPFPSKPSNAHRSSLLILSQISSRCLRRFSS